MLALRVGLVALATAACAWFVLGAVEVHAMDRASALLSSPQKPSSAETAQILNLLDRAGTLNPDRDVQILRADAYQRANDIGAAERELEWVVRAEPENINAWIMLAFVAHVRGDLATSRLAHAEREELAPPVGP